MRHLLTNVEQLDTDVDVVRDDFSQLIDEVAEANFLQSIKQKVYQELTHFLI